MRAVPHRDQDTGAPHLRGLQSPQQEAIAQKRMGYRADVDGLRAIAVLAVMWFHLVAGAHEGLIVSVDMFFVISGYLITRVQWQSIDQAPMSQLLRFYAARVRRMFPALLLVLSAALGWAAWCWDPQSLEHLAKETLASGLFVQNFWLASQIGYFDLAAYQRPLLHLWTLAIEEQFYVLWPLVMYLLYRLAPSRIALLSALLSLVLLVITLYQHHVSPNASHYYQPWMRAWALLLGCALACFEQYQMSAAAHQGHRLRYAQGLSLLGFALILIGFVWTNRINHLGGMVIAAALGTALMIAAGPKAWINEKILGSPALLWIGLMSYPLYLWHWLLKSMWLQSDERLSLELSGKIPQAPSAGLVLTESIAIAALAFFLAALTWYWIEKPLRQRERFPNIWIGLLAGMLAVISCACLILQSNGWLSRLPKDAQGYRTDEALEKNAYRSGECFIERAEDFAKALLPPETCFDRPQKGKPTVLLWGDSHAAQYVSGLRPLAVGQGWGFAQLSVAACPPHQVNAADWCKQVQTAQAQWLEKHRPDVVVLGSAWALSTEAGVDAFAAKLHAQGIKLLVIGPSPIWARSLPQMLQREALLKPDSMAQDKGKVTSEASYRNRGLLPDAAIIEARMKKALSTPLVSVLSMLCKPDIGCLSNHEGQTISWDQAHLSQRGSSYVAPALWGAIKGILQA